ncbi:MAG: glycoside hydrolase family 25 protein [Clostridium sp.]|nr:glycoside hydrolase family 25 protein [Clostridium sp.]
MKKHTHGDRRMTLVIVFICVALAFAVLWGIVTGIEKLMHYGENATIETPPPSSQEPVEPELPEIAPEAEEALAKNRYSADGFYERNGIRYYHGGDYEGVPGIDVSSYQEDIDWDAVKESGIEFAIIRVGYRGYKSGELDLDNCFVEHMEGALAAGLEVGVYFFSQALSPEEAKEEAEFVLEQIKDYRITYPVVYDWEEIDGASDARTNEMNMLMLTSCAQAFCETIKAGGYEPCIYFNQAYGYQQFNLLSLEEHMFWLAEYDPFPSFAYHFQMWQYTNEGVVPGIEGHVDMNIAFRKKK